MPKCYWSFSTIQRKEDNIHFQGVLFRLDGKEIGSGQVVPIEEWKN
jgi:hypothetical protein